MDGVTIDANIISRAYPELVREDGCLYNMVEAVLQKHGLALTSLAEQEWLNCCRGPFLQEWITDNTKNGRINYVEASLGTEERKDLKRMGFPMSRDIEYIRIANVTNIRYLVSEDIHFYEPKAKDYSPKKKNEIMMRRSGCVCRYLRKNLQIVVGTSFHCSAELC